MRRPIVAGNWKMNGDRASAVELIDNILAGIDGIEAEIVVCPPFILIPDVVPQLTGSVLKWGGQDLSEHHSGAYTGEVAADMLKDYGCNYCIVGHSERRTLYGETDDIVARKFAMAQKSGLTPILCIGETLNQRESGETETVLERQLEAVLNHCGIESFASAVVAYEPVWAIGTGKTASPEQVQDVHGFVRDKLSMIDKKIARGLRIQYGGSVKADNAEALFSQQDVDGGLIGGASLDAEDFLAICRAA